MLRRAAATTLAILTAACTPPAAATPKPAPVAVTQMVMWDPSLDTVQTLVDTLLAEHAQGHPSFIVRYEHMQYDTIPSRALEAIAAGQGPDVFMANSYAWPLLVDRRAVVDLEPTAFNVTSLAELEALFVPGLLRRCRYQGRLCVYPTVVSSIIPMWLPDIFPEGFPRTWQGLIEASWHRIREQDLLSDTFHFDVGSAEALLSNLGPFVWQMGGEVISPDGSQCLINRPESVAGVALLKRMVDEGVWKPHIQFSYDRMVAGLSGACYCGDWCLPHVDAMSEAQRTSKVQLAQVPVVAEQVNGVNYMVPAGYLVSANTKHVLECWRLISWLCHEPRNARRWLHQAAFFNGRLGSWVQEAQAMDPRLKVAHEALAWGTLGFMSPKFDECMSILVNAISDIMYNDNPIQATLDNATVAVDAILAGQGAGL